MSQVRKEFTLILILTFSIVFAYALCTRIDPHTISINQSQLRDHPLECFQTRALTPSPPSAKPRQMGQKRHAVEKMVSVYCVCCLPWSKREMEDLVQCKSCGEWLTFHQDCMDIPPTVLSELKWVWFCSACIECCTCDTFIAEPCYQFILHSLCFIQ